MLMKTKMLKKLCALSLSAIMLTGAGICEAAPLISASLPVYAVEAVTPASSFEYKTNEEGGITISAFIGNESNVVISKKINGKPVTEIGNDAFVNCISLKAVKIPNGVTRIGYSAFYGCTGLTSVNIPDSVKTIDGNYIQQGGAFERCTGLKSVTIPNSVTHIGSCVFKGCKGLADNNGFVVVGNTLYDYLGESKNVIIPDSVTKISGGAFFFCEGLNSITIPDSVTYIFGILQEGIN